MPPKRLKIGIIGGSLSGLFMGLAMKSLGHKVHIFERYPKRTGAGIMITPPMFDFFQKFKIKGINNHNSILYSTRSVVTDKHNNLNIMDHPDKPRPQTSYNHLYDNLLMQYSLRNGNYHVNKRMKSIVAYNNNNSTHANTGSTNSNTPSTKIIFDDNTEFDCDLVIGCDGISSSVRGLLPGNNDFKLDYAGYIAWRGVIPLNCIKNDTNGLLNKKIDDITNNYGGILYHGNNSQFVGYTIPNNSRNNPDFLSKELNWVWYKSIDNNLMNKFLIDINGNKHNFSIPKGKLNAYAKEYLLKQSKLELPSLLNELVITTTSFYKGWDDSNLFRNYNNNNNNNHNDGEDHIETEDEMDDIVDRTFLQVILDGDSNRYVIDESDIDMHGRVMIAGDAACVVRPHTVRATSKASFDAITLYDLFIKHGNNMEMIGKEYERIVKENNVKIMNEAIELGNKAIFPDNDENRSLKTAMDQNVNTSSRE